MKQSKLPQPFSSTLRSTHSTRPHPPSASSYASSSSSSSTSSFEFPSSRSPSPFEIFHLPRSASTSQIKERYYQLVKLYHPDVAGSKSNPASSLQEEEIARRFKLIRDAYELLSSPSRRQRYINFHEGWNHSRAHTPNRSWRNNHTSTTPAYRDMDPDFNLSSVWTQFINRHRAGFYSSVHDHNGGSTDGFDHPHDPPNGRSYTFKQQWERDGLFAKNGVFISAVGCFSLCLYLVQLWRVLPLVGSPDHPLQPSSSSSSKKEKNKFHSFIEPAGDARLDQEAWAKLRAIQFTTSHPHPPSSSPPLPSPSPSPSPPALLDHQNPHPNHRFYSSSFQDRIQKQNLKALSDLKSARASAVKPSVFSNRISSDSSHSPPTTSNATTS